MRIETIENELEKVIDAMQIFKSKLSKQGIVKNERDIDHLNALKKYAFELKGQLKGQLKNYEN